MVDSVALLVDASEGVMAQTKFVLRKAIGRGLRPLVVLNKIDRDTARPDEVTNELFDTMVAMGVRRAPSRARRASGGGARLHSPRRGLATGAQPGSQEAGWWLAKCPSSWHRALAHPSTHAASPPPHGNQPPFPCHCRRACSGV